MRVEEERRGRERGDRIGREDNGGEWKDVDGSVRG